MADRVRYRALRRLGGIPAMNVDAHAHLGNTTHARHAVLLDDFSAG
jgi:hypothetical protein